LCDLAEELLVRQMEADDTLGLLAAVAGALGNKSVRDYERPRERLEAMITGGTVDRVEDPALRRLQISAVTGSDGDIVTAEG
jgi:hypothetical protein